MAFTRPTGKHRRTNRRATRTGAGLAGVAALTTTGVVGTLASPAAAGEAPAHTGLTQAITIGDSLADRIGDQAAAQRLAAEAAAAEQAAVEAARVQAAEAKQKAEKERAEKIRAARAAERERLNRYVLPVEGSYVSTGYRTGGSLWSSGSHSGVDFHAPSGSVVRAVGAGTVVQTGWGGAYGNEVVVKMHDGTYTQYGHLTSATVSVGQTVTPGQQIAVSGSTGNSTGPHLHFEARSGADYGTDMDPVAYLRGHGVDV
ncbi:MULTISPECIES: M23 family metallopeptidase [Streptomyces]|uniref:Peptidase n=3 Tax=Streptomyces TaxID=1883 RepID=A0A8H9HHW7_9ACTN|nr:MULTISPECIES: M23 family metallopeptidase [Streptomyces]MDQ0292753.1 murein DD-endopeptidase MepM/ murein hydrolase activator NlpD [Streptomyces sp. DSM 41037]PJM80735.1 peptidase [Streptomyces sp. TSRI0384-2]RPK86668.1 Glycyl-glycine endopeptidase ALE-1 precursor [Streptomyces sp. ADI98-12]WSU35280.1 M23 family metallopeptidase [Streptomyces gougerotii]SUP59719.1 Peptidase [Streptomyces griseus]